MSPAETSATQGIAASTNAPGSTSISHSRLRFGLYEVDLQKCELRKGGLKLKIPHQSFQILARLLQNPGAVVGRETLRQELWPSDVFVNFEGSLNSAVQKLRSVLQDTSRKPRYIETLPREGYRFISKVEPLTAVTAEAPVGTASQGSAEQLVDLQPAAEGLEDEASEELPAPHRNLRWWTVAILLALVVLTVVYGRYRYSRSVRQAKGTPAQSTPIVPVSIASVSQVRRSIAIVGFSNVSGDEHNLWLSTAFTEMLATELAAGDHLRTVAGEDVTRAKLDLSLSNEDSYGPNTLHRIHKDLGCDYVITGSYLAIGQAENGKLRLDVRVQDAVNGDTIANVAVVGSRSSLFDLASRAGEQIRAKLGAGSLSEIELEEAKVSLPADPEAARLYSEGLAKLRVYDDVEAGHLFERVIRLQPEYAPAYSALASVRHALGYDTEATAAARKALELAGNMPEQARLQAEARFHEMNEDWTRAVEVYSRLQRAYPDNLDYGLDLASAQLNMGNAAQAAATIAALRELPPPQRDDPRIDLTEASIAGALADYKREQTLAGSAAGKSEAAGARLLLARAKQLDGTASFFLGNLTSAVDADAVAQHMFAESGDLDRSAVAAMNIGGVLASRGDVIAATHSIEQALKVFRKQGDQARLTAALSNLGSMYEIEGNLPMAEDLFREAIAVSAKLNQIKDIETYNLAELLERRGKFREAKDMLVPLLARVRSGGNKSVAGAATQTLGSIAENQGELAAALQMYQDAVAQLKETGARADITSAERSLAKAFLEEGDFVSAKQVLSEALSLDRETGAKTDTALDQVGLAELSLAHAEPVDVGTLRSVIDEFRLQKIIDGEIEAEIVLSRGTIQAGNFAEAASFLRQATIVSARSYDPTVHFDVALAAGHLRTVERRFDEAKSKARSALRIANVTGCVRCQLEARLELGEIEIQGNNAEKGRAELRQLADEARRRGFGLLAQHAGADSVGPG